MSWLWDRMIKMVDKALTWLLSPLERWENIHDALYVSAPIIFVFAICRAANLVMTIWR